MPLRGGTTCAAAAVMTFGAGVTPLRRGKRPAGSLVSGRAGYSILRIALALPSVSTEAA